MEIEVPSFEVKNVGDVAIYFEHGGLQLTGDIYQFINGPVELVAKPGTVLDVQWIKSSSVGMFLDVSTSPDYSAFDYYDDGEMLLHKITVHPDGTINPVDGDVYMMPWSIRLARSIKHLFGK